MSVVLADSKHAGDRDETDRLSGTPLRWGVCFALIVGLHLGGAWVAIRWQGKDEAAAVPPAAAVMIELAPLPAAPPAAPTAIPPGPEQVVSQPPPPPEPVVQPVLPPTPPSPAPRVAVPLLPKPPPKPPKRQQKPVEHERPASRPELKPPAAATTAPPQADLPPAHDIAAPAPGIASVQSTNAMPTWQGLLLGRLERFKRYPALAQFRRQQGVAYLRFTMDRQGKVLSATLQKSSGFSSLDDEALALIHRAEPLPPPPPEVPGDPIDLVVPVEFSMK
jgi:protein TonB